MAVNREWVKEVRAVLAEATRRPQARATGDTEAWQRFQAEQQLQSPVALEQTPRARAIREINRIAGTYGWGDEVRRALDKAGAGFLADLLDHEVDDLASHMRRLVDNAQTACDHFEGLPAR